MMNTTSLGYQLSHSNDEIARALSKAYELVARGRELGVHIRQESLETTKRVKQMIVVSKSLLKGDGKEANVIENHLLDMTCCEGKILLILRAYMNETGSLMANLKILNPPLISHQLKPFIDALASDRQLTLGSLEPLSKSVQELMSLKSNLQRRLAPAYTSVFPA